MANHRVVGLNGDYRADQHYCKGGMDIIVDEPVEFPTLLPYYITMIQVDSRPLAQHLSY